MDKRKTTKRRTRSRSRKKKGSLKSLLIVIFVLGIIGSFGNSDKKENKKPSTTPYATNQTKTEDIKVEQTEKQEEIYVEISQDQKEALQLNLKLSSTDKSEVDEITETEVAGHRNEKLNGRGRSDAGRTEPSYVGVIGYVAVRQSDYDIENTDTWMNDPSWTVPTYQKDKQYYEEVGSIPHKTEVIVKSQTLEHEGYGRYSGYLNVEDTATGKAYCISVSNFITKPYWEYDIEDVALTGLAVAEFHQKSDYYPVTKSGKADIEDGTRVLITGPTGTYGKGGPDNKTNSIEAKVFANWKYGYGGVDVFFNAKDLSIIY